MSFADDFGNGIDSAEHVRYMGHGNDARAVVEHRAEGLHVEGRAVGGEWHNAQRKAVGACS